MKINPEMSSAIKVVSPVDKDDRRAEASNDRKKKIEDYITLANKQASSAQVENVEDAKEMLSQVVDSMAGYSNKSLYNMNLQRVMNLIQ